MIPRVRYAGSMEKANDNRGRAKAFAQEAGIPFEHFEALAAECEDDPRKLSVLARGLALQKSTMRARVGRAAAEAAGRFMRGAGIASVDTATINDIRDLIWWELFPDDKPKEETGAVEPV